MTVITPIVKYTFRHTQDGGLDACPNSGHEPFTLIGTIGPNGYLNIPDPGVCFFCGSCPDLIRKDVSGALDPSQVSFSVSG